MVGVVLALLVFRKSADPSLSFPPSAGCDPFALPSSSPFSSSSSLDFDFLRRNPKKLSDLDLRDLGTFSGLVDPDGGSVPPWYRGSFDRPLVSDPGGSSSEGPGPT